MGRIENDIIVDLTDFSLQGEVLDMGFESKGAIYRALRQRILYDTHFETAASMDSCADIEDCQWVYGYPEKLPFKDNTFDAATAFFSISFLKRKYIRNKVIKEVARALKDGGKLYIWDMNTDFKLIKPKKKIKILLKGGEEIVLELKGDRVPRCFSLYSITPVISRYFKIVDEKDFGGHFYIEAVKKDDTI